MRGDSWRCRQRLNAAAMLPGLFAALAACSPPASTMEGAIRGDSDIAAVDAHMPAPPQATRDGGESFGCSDEFFCPDGGSAVAIDAEAPSTGGVQAVDAGMLDAGAPSPTMDGGSVDAVRSRDPFLVSLFGSDRTVCAITRSGHLHCDRDYVSNTNLERIDGPNADPRGGYVQVAPTSSAVCALHEEGDVRCWGSLLGSDEPPKGSDFIAIAGGTSRFCALHKSGEVLCWGQQDGNHPAGGDADEPRDITALTASRTKTCGLRRSGDLFCWDGRTPDIGTFNDRFGNPPVPQGIVQLEASHGSLCVLTNTGQATCWGMLGDGAPFTAPQRRFRHISRMAFGDYAFCGVLESGDLFCDTYGRLWPVAFTATTAPHDAPYTHVVATGSAIFALRADGTLAKWDTGP